MDMVYHSTPTLTSMQRPFFGSNGPQDIAEMQRQLQLRDTMWCQENNVSLTVSRPNELTNSSPFRRETLDSHIPQPISATRHMNSWFTPPSIESSSPRSNPYINITPPASDELSTIHGHHYTSSNTPMSSTTSYDISPQYSYTELPSHDGSLRLIDVSMPEKLTADWVQQVNQVSFEPVIIDPSGQDTFLSGSMMHWQDHTQNSHMSRSGGPTMTATTTTAQLWSNPQWAAMYSRDNSTLAPMDPSYYLSSTSSPFSSAPQSPLRDLFSISPINTPELSRQSSPDIVPSSTTTTTLNSPPPTCGQNPKGKFCSHCKATSTPLWRRHPGTQKQLCNACGLYLQQRGKLRPQQLIDADADEPLDTPYDPNAPECSHCHTRNTSVWRRNKDGEQLCNACGVYRRLRGKDRPLSLRRNRIKPRTKHNTSNTV